MPKSIKDYLAKANAEVEKLEYEHAKARMADGALVVDGRDATEIEASGLLLCARRTHPPFDYTILPGATVLGWPIGKRFLIAPPM